MSLSTLSYGSLTIPYMPMTIPILECPPPVLESNFENCRIPGGVDLWSSNGFYSPGQCFEGYQAECTQTDLRDDAWPLVLGETAVRCIPTGYDCNDEDGNPRFATTVYDGTTLSAPAFEIRWRSEDLKTGEEDIPWPTVDPLTSTKTMPTTSASEMVPGTSVATPAVLKSSPAAPEETGEPPGEPTEPPKESTETPQESTEPLSSPMTTGSIAGIAIGAAAGSLITGLGIIYLAMRYRRRKKANAKTNSDNDAPYQPQPSYAVSPNQPPVELHPETMGPKELESEPVSPQSNMFPCSPTSPTDSLAQRVVCLNEVPIEMAGDATFTRGTGVSPEERLIGTTRDGGND